MTDDGGRKLKKLNGSPGRARSDVPVEPVNDDLPESLAADLVFTGLCAQNSATIPVCCTEMGFFRPRSLHK